MTSKCPTIRAAVIAREAKKMQFEAAKEHAKILQEEYKLLVQEVKDEKERFKSGEVTTGPRLYKDNAANKKLGRVGQPIPSKKKVKKTIATAAASAAAASASDGGSSDDGTSDGSAKEAKATTQRLYKDNAANRKLGRVGQPIPSRKGKKKTKKVENKAVASVESPKTVSKAAEPEEVVENNELGLSSLFGDSDSDSDSDSSSDDGF